MTRLNEEQLVALFHEPRTAYSFTDEPVTDEQLRRIQELTFYGPSAFNSQPLRITWIKSPEARERLISYLVDGNKPKAESAPMIALLSADHGWVEKADTFNPRSLRATTLTKTWPSPPPTSMHTSRQATSSPPFAPSA